MKLMVYDAEIVNAIPEKGQPQEMDIRYCAGWGDKEGMGVSVISAYVWDHGYRIFMRDNFDAFRALAEDPDMLCMGFNNRVFDDILVERALGIRIDVHRSWDLLRAVRVARRESPGLVGGISLDKLCRANFLPGKTGDGAQAPILWQRGKTGQVIDYALNDCRQTVALVELVMAGRLRDPDSGRVLVMPLPDAGLE